MLAVVVAGGAAVAVTRAGDTGGGASAPSTTARAGATTGSGAPVTTAGRQAPSPTSRPGVGTVVVLGDSYSAGNGGGGRTGPCYRSGASAVHRYADAVGAQVVDASCSGAVVSDLVAPDRAGRPPQESAVDRHADVVVLTMGGNDIGFGDLVTQCFLLATGSRPRGCADAVARARSLLPTVQAHLVSALLQVRSRMRPDAVLVLRAYPLLAPDHPFVQQGGYDANANLRALGTEGVAMQERVVAAVRAGAPGGSGARTYFDTSALRVFAGHELGASTPAGSPGRSAATSGSSPGTTTGRAAEPFFTGFQTPGADLSDVFHPNALGQAAWGHSLQAFLAPLTR
ncbi:hypothetical protein GCM10027517_15920 [Phycicoccus ginsengisoli]